jgi:dTDP-4-dehydrorhamnose 3,5-epimerase
MVYVFKELGMGIILIENEVYEDQRGFFVEGYNREAFAENGIENDFMQYVFSRSKKGVFRGLHFQKDPYSQAKLLRVIRGEIFDVAVDIRPGSSTFGKHVEIRLKGDGRQMIYIPRNFAHGFVALEDSDVLYYVDNEYSQKSECGILWNDPELGINYPLEPTLMSPKDAKWKPLNQTVI